MDDTTGILIFCAVCGLLAFFVIHSRRKIQKMGFDLNQIFNAQYTCGHPKIDKPMFCTVGMKDGNIYFLSTFNKIIAEIAGTNVKNILVEDESTFRNKVTLARIALVGIFAFALKKKKKEELAYLTIEWSDGRFEHSTVFEYAKNGALQKANTDRNKIINALK